MIFPDRGYYHLHGTLADPETKGQFLNIFLLGGKQPENLPVPFLFSLAGTDPCPLENAAGLRTTQTGRREFATFIPVMAKLGEKVGFLIEEVEKRIF